MVAMLEVVVVAMLEVVVAMLEVVVVAMLEVVVAMLEVVVAAILEVVVVEVVVLAMLEVVLAMLEGGGGHAEGGGGGCARGTTSPLLHKGWVCTGSSYREKEMTFIYTVEFVILGHNIFWVPLMFT